MNDKYLECDVCEAVIVKENFDEHKKVNKLGSDHFRWNNFLKLKLLDRNDQVFIFWKLYYSGGWNTKHIQNSICFVFQWLTKWSHLALGPLENRTLEHNPSPQATKYCCLNFFFIFKLFILNCNCLKINLSRFEIYSNPLNRVVRYRG